MTRLFLALFATLFAFSAARAADGMVTHACTGTAKATLDRIETIAGARGLKIFARIDHAAGARSIGESLQPTELLILGHPKGGTPLLQCGQTYGLDLPLRVLAWEDAEGRCRVGYAAPDSMVARHGNPECLPIAKRLTGTLDQLVLEADSPR
ncbi:MAG: DUF302 domain-containing protein [Pseudomonadota bacterium]